MIKKKYFILLLILFLLSLSICVAADNDSISPDTQYTEYNEKDSIAENNNIFENLDNNKIYEKKENNSLIDRNGDVIQKKNISSVKTANQEKKITITEKNFNNYFIYNNGIVRLDKSILLENRDYIYLINYLPYDVNKITIDITDSNFENNSMKFVGRNNNTLTNCALTIDSNIKNITVENFNLIFNENYQLTTFVTVGTRTNLCVLNNISVNVDVEQTGSQSYVLSLNKPTIVENSNITVKCLETNIDWYGPGDKIPTIVPIVVKSSNCLMNNNRIHITSKGHRTESYYSLYGVYIGGDNFIFTNNSICVDNATGYAYGFVDRSKNNLILDNFVEVYSEAYSAGINIEGAAIHNNIVKNNRIHLVAGNDTSQAGLGNPSVAYAIEILDYVYNGGPYKNYKNSPKATNNSFINNTITGFARQFYGFEIYGGANTLIENNTINATGSVTMGIGAIGENVTINNNYIEVRGLHNQTEATVDYIVAMTAGIYNFYSSDGIKITNNTLLVEKGKGIKTSECENILIENNLIITEDYAYTLEISGSNNSIKYNGIIHENNIKDTIIVSENNTVKNNREPTNSQLTINIPETIEINKQTNMIITLKDEFENTIPNQYITVKIGNENEHTFITDENGECTFDYTPTKLGTTTITAEYKCYQNYGSTITKNIIVKKQDTHIIIDIIPLTKYQDNITITGTLKDTNNQPITANITLTINGEENTITTDIDGTYTFTSIAKVLGTNNITVSYTGNSKYNPTNTTTTFQVIPKDTIINIDEIQDTQYTDNATITGLFKTESGSPLKTSTVAITVNGVKSSVKTDNKGVFTYTYKTKNVGTNNVTVSYGGNAKYNPTSTTTTFNVIPKDTVITIDKIQDTQYTDNATITGTFKTTSGTPLKTSTVTLYINGVKASAKTDNNGVFVYNYKTKAIGTNNITVSYAGNAKINPTNTTTTVQVIPKDTVITIDEIADTQYTDTVTITGTFKTTSGVALKNSLVSITINGAKASIRTDANGTFAYNYKTKAAGTNNVTVSYCGNAKYNPTSTTTTFQVIPKDTIITINKINQTKLSNTVTITGTFKPTSGVALKSSKLTLNINGAKVSVKTDNNGIFIYNYKTKTLGTNNVTVSYAGNTRYAATKTNTTFQVVN